MTSDRESAAERIAQLDALLDAYDSDTLGDDPAEFDEWLKLYDEREKLRALRGSDQ